MTRYHPRLVEIGPDRGEILLLDAEEVDSLPAGDLDHAGLVLLRNIGDGAQLLRRGYAPPHAGNHGIGTILLDVGMRPLIDES